MKFALKYWWSAYKKEVKRTGKAIVFYTAVSLIIVLSNLKDMGDFATPSSLILLIKVLMYQLVFYYGYIAIETIIDNKGNYKYVKMFNDKGYCAETFDYFYRNYIQDRLLLEANYVELAEHYRRLGDYDSAINTLNSIHVPESSRHLRTEYIFVFMKIAANRNDTALADNVWNSNQDFINYVISDEKFGEKVNLLYLVMIYADCAAGKYDHALEICDSFLSGEQLKECNLHTENFMVIKIYLLKKLGREAEMDAAVIALNDFAEKKWKPFYDFRRIEYKGEAEKAIMGELPV